WCVICRCCANRLLIVAWLSILTLAVLIALVAGYRIVRFVGETNEYQIYHRVVVQLAGAIGEFLFHQFCTTRLALAKLYNGQFVLPLRALLAQYYRLDNL